jgi:hypothetical protein
MEKHSCPIHLSQPYHWFIKKTGFHCPVESFTFLYICLACSILPSHLFSFFSLLCGTGVWTQGLALARQVFYYLSHTSTPEQIYLIKVLHDPEDFRNEDSNSQGKLYFMFRFEREWTVMQKYDLTNQGYDFVVIYWGKQQDLSRFFLVSL